MKIAPWGGWRAAWLAVLTAAATACGGLPSESYEWNAALAGSGGKLDGMVKALPLGNLSLLEHQHPDDPKKDTITFSNADGEPGSSPLEMGALLTKGDWTQPSLAVLRKAHDQTRLEVCKLRA